MVGWLGVVGDIVVRSRLKFFKLKKREDERVGGGRCRGGASAKYARDFALIETEHLTIHLLL